MIDKGRVVAYGVLLLFTVSTCALLFTPYVSSITGGFNWVQPGKLMRNDTSQGWVTTSRYLYHQGFTKAGTNGLLEFTDVKLGSGGYVTPHLGWCSDTAAVNMTITAVTQEYMIYTATGAGTQRVWCPDGGEPYDVEGDSSESWSAANQVATITTDGAATVKVIWYGSSSGSMWDSVTMMINLLPLLLLFSVIGALRVPEHRVFFIQFAAICGVIIFIANMLHGMGL